ncbi:TolC family protein [Flavobacterium buctense]|uniref:TolC family protein n=1 Tax=Flavobacterium buctense TaxID=1648146 RepID=A0ABU9DXY7_9FLAO|nr:TolC family protein [Flavobacterium buctense]
MKNKLILTLFLAISFLHAQEKKESYSFSLQQAIEHAIKNNYSALNANRDIDVAKQKKWETTAAGLPQINAGVNYVNNFELTQQGAAGGGPFGGNPSDVLTFAFGTKHNMNAAATLSQLIFDGSYIVALQASKTYLKYYENAKRKNNTEIREMVINAYGNVLLAEESVAILEKNKATLSKTLTDTEETYKNGLIEEENVEQLQITLAAINSNLNNTKRLQDVAYKMLKLTLGIDIDADLQLTDKLDSLSASNLDLAFSKGEFAVTNNINYQMATNFQEQRTLELKLQRSKALPTLSAAVNFGYNSFANEFNFTSSQQKWNNFSNLGVSLNVPIFSSFGRSAKTQQAKIALDQAKTQLIQTEQQLKLEYERAKSEYEFSIEEYATSKSNLNLAERIERKQQIKFTEGLSSSFDFSEAQRQLYTAQQNYLQSMVNIINKKATLEKIINKN